MDRACPNQELFKDADHVRNVLPLYYFLTRNPHGHIPIAELKKRFKVGAELIKRIRRAIDEKNHSMYVAEDRSTASEVIKLWLCWWTPTPEKTVPFQIQTLPASLEQARQRSIESGTTWNTHTGPFVTLLAWQIVIFKTGWRFVLPTRMKTGPTPSSRMSQGLQLHPTVQWSGGQRGARICFWKKTSSLHPSWFGLELLVVKKRAYSSVLPEWMLKNTWNFWETTASFSSWDSVEIVPSFNKMGLAVTQQHRRDCGLPSNKSLSWKGGQQTPPISLQLSRSGGFANVSLSKGLEWEHLWQSNNLKELFLKLTSTSRKDHQDSNDERTVSSQTVHRKKWQVCWRWAGPVLPFGRGVVWGCNIISTVPSKRRWNETPVWRKSGTDRTRDVCEASLIPGQHEKAFRF